MITRTVERHDNVSRNVTKCQCPASVTLNTLAQGCETSGFDRSFFAAEGTDLVRRLGNDVAPCLREPVRERVSPARATAQLRD
jgi:hypothetical protein